MSINLTLVIDKHGVQGPVLAYERLRLNYQDNNIFERIKAKSVPLFKAVEWYGDEGLKSLEKDAYGEPITYIPAGTVASILGTASLQGWDAAILAFVRALSPDTKIILWWC